MKRRDKLVLTGLVSLVVGCSLVAILVNLFSDPDPDQVAIDRPRQQSQMELLRERARLAESRPVPKELDKVNNYIDERWGHMEEAPENLTSIENDGQKVTWNRKLAVGFTGDGKKAYGLGVSIDKKFDGVVMNLRNRQSSHGVGVVAGPAVSMTPGQAALPGMIPMSEGPEGIFGPTSPYHNLKKQAGNRKKKQAAEGEGEGEAGGEGGGEAGGEGGGEGAGEGAGEAGGQ